MGVFNENAIMGASAGGAEWVWSGEDYGYESGGYSTSNQVTKWTLASVNTATLVGTLSYARRGHGTGNSNTANGFVFHMGGAGNTTRITKNTTASDTASNDVGVTSQVHGDTGSSDSETHGYVWCGNDGNPKNIDKVAFVSGSSGTNVGNIDTVGRYGGSAQTGEDAIYFAGGYGTPTYHKNIQKKATSSDGDSTTHGTLSSYGSNQVDGVVGNSDIENGYGFAAGGHAYNSNIAKFAFAGTGVGSVSHGSLQTVRIRGVSCSTPTFGMYNGGSQTWATTLISMRSYPFGATSGETNWGADLYTANALSNGMQA